MIPDTADQRSAQTAARQARWTLPCVFLDGLPAPALLLDGNGRVVLANAGAVHLLGFAQSELIGQAAEEFLSDGSKEPKRDFPSAARQPANGRVPLVGRASSAS